MFWVISVYFNIRNTLPKSGTFLLGHPVYSSVFTVFCLQKDALVEILILSVPQSQLFLFNVYKVKNVEAQRVMTITVTSFLG